LLFSSLIFHVEDERSKAMVNTLKQVQVKTGQPPKDDTTPRMPHERDEVVETQTKVPRESMKQAYDDLQQGQVDTDMRGVRGVDQINKSPEKKAPEGDVKKRRSKG